MALGIKNSWKYEKDLIHILNSILAINAITRLPYLFMTIKKKFLQKRLMCYFRNTDMILCVCSSAG